MKGKTHIIAKFLWTDSVICSHSREGETSSYSRINTVDQQASSSVLALWLLMCLYAVKDCCS